MAISILSANYTYGGNNVPSARNNAIIVKLPMTPSYPTGNAYHYFTSEFSDSTEVSLGAGNLSDVAMQFWVTAMAGRFTTQFTHWDQNNLPEEVFIVEPGPAGCGGNNDYTSPVTAISCGQTWDTNYVYTTNNFQSFTETSNPSDIPGNADWAHKPGYIIDMLPEVQGVSGLEDSIWICMVVMLADGIAYSLGRYIH